MKAGLARCDATRLIFAKLEFDAGARHEA